METALVFQESLNCEVLIDKPERQKIQDEKTLDLFASAKEVIKYDYFVFYGSCIKPSKIHHALSNNR